VAILRKGSVRELVGAVLAALIAGSALAAPPPPAATAAEVKAAFLCSFAEFVDWPPAAKNDPVTIGILGRDPFGQLLDETMQVRALQNRALAVKRVSTLDEALRCQIVFISDSEKRRLDEILRGLSRSSILTVSDIDGFAERGGIIGFFVEDNRVRFQINQDAAGHASLQISSRLLKLARLVATDARKGTSG
jgi:hypothetical protein